ncbi:MAG: hypothetical protein KatS3mg131_1353 [Candidatus Tectimicrobiota bacterium]|nr:MAG: hypothetical protein KatS3mg131_1353 [Candidatus Tectomicrobia bacterium]
MASNAKRTRLLRTVAVTLGLLGLLSCAAVAQKGLLDERDPVSERQQLMKNQGANFKDLRDKAKAGNFAAIAVNAQNIAFAARHIPLLFPKGSLGTPEQKSRAKPEIWQDWDGFIAATTQTRDAALALWELTKDAEKQPVSAEQVQAAIKNLAESCKGCHDKFRKPKEQQ